MPVAFIVGALLKLPLRPEAAQLRPQSGADPRVSKRRTLGGAERGGLWVLVNPEPCG